MYPMETGFSAGADQELLRKAWGFLGAQERGVLEGMYAGKPSALSALESICEENRDEQRKKTGKPMFEVFLIGSAWVKRCV